MRHAEDQAKQCIRENDKSGAERWARQMKSFREEQKRLCAMLEKLDMLNGTYQQARLTRDTLLVTEAATAKIKDLGINADKADDIMDNARDAIADIEDVNRVIMAPLTRDADVSEELAQLESEIAPAHVMPEPPVVVRPPTPPMVRELREAIPA